MGREVERRMRSRVYAIGRGVRGTRGASKLDERSGGNEERMNMNSHRKYTINCLLTSPTFNPTIKYLNLQATISPPVHLYLLQLLGLIARASTHWTALYLLTAQLNRSAQVQIAHCF